MIRKLIHHTSSMKELNRVVPQIKCHLVHKRRHKESPKKIFRFRLYKAKGITRNS